MAIAQTCNQEFYRLGWPWWNISTVRLLHGPKIDVHVVTWCNARSNEWWVPGKSSDTDFNTCPIQRKSKQERSLCKCFSATN